MCKNIIRKILLRSHLEKPDFTSERMFFHQADLVKSLGQRRYVATHFKKQLRSLKISALNFGQNKHTLVFFKCVKFLTKLTHLIFFSKYVMKVHHYC